MKKSRKKMLLSSIAMMLVALVALGSATFAWYFTNTSVTASTTEFKASSSDGLVIRHEVGEAWGTEVTDLKKAPASGLMPASIDYNAGFDTVKGCTAKGTDYDDGSIASGSYGEITHANLLTNTTNYVIDHFFVGTQGASAKTGVNFTITTAGATGTYMNLAIYINGTLSKVYTSDGSTSVSNRVAAQNNQTPVTYTSEELKNGTVTASFSAAPIGTDLNAETGTRVDIIAFADGENQNCKSSNVKLNNFTVTYNFSTSA